MTRLGVVVATMWTIASPASAQDRVIGLLSLPEVFGRGTCDPYVPQSVPLRATPDGEVVGAIRVASPRTIEGGGCSGLDVVAGVGLAADRLPTREFDYELPGAVVLERRQRWFRVRVAGGSAWLRASGADEFYSLERLYRDSLTYLTPAWNGQLAERPGAVGRPVHRDDAGRSPSVRVRRSAIERGAQWFLIEYMSHSGCAGGDEPTVVDSGWVPAHSAGGEPTIWFYSRGC